MKTFSVHKTHHFITGRIPQQVATSCQRSLSDATLATPTCFLIIEYETQITTTRTPSYDSHWKLWYIPPEYVPTWFIASKDIISKNSWIYFRFRLGTVIPEVLIRLLSSNTTFRESVLNLLCTYLKMKYNVHTDGCRWRVK